MKTTTKTSGIAIAAALACCLLFALTPAMAAAWTPPPFFTQFPDPPTRGSGAGQLGEPNAVAFSAVDRHLYVADPANRRIAVYDAWGTFVRAFGWGVLDGSPEPQVCTALSGCQAAVAGEGPGQFSSGATSGKGQGAGPGGLAIDPAGNLYAMDVGNQRVQKFTPGGDFVLAIGGKVNKTTEANVCTAASGDVCGAGVEGTGPGEFSIQNVFGVLGDYLTVAGDTLYAGDRNRIQTFDLDGGFKAEIPLPEAGNPGSLDVDPVSGTIYFGYAQNVAAAGPPLQPNVYRLDAAGGEVGPPLEASEPKGVAVAPGGGDVYVGHAPADFNPNGSGKSPDERVDRISVFDPNGAKLGEFGNVHVGNSMPAVATGVVGEDPSEYDVYAVEFSQLDEFAAINVYGATPDPDVVGPPPSVPPTITEQFASSVETDSATLRARINPKFWADTTYQLEYGTEDCALGGCAKAPGAPLTLTDDVVSEALLAPGVPIGGLQPGTTYHYRFAAQSSGGGPVFGPDRTFTTASIPPPLSPCPANAAFRTGPGALLPDCRAYEMVSPLDKNNSDIVSLFSSEGQFAALNKSAASGDRFTYSAARSFCGGVASPYSSQYLAVRDPGSGWSCTNISPPRKLPFFSVWALDVQFRLFDEQLCRSWFVQDTALALSPLAAPGFPNIYTRDLCTDGDYEPTVQSEPAALLPAELLLELQGAGGGHSVIRANDSLIPGIAPAGEAAKVYDYFEGGLAYVCVLPDGKPFAGGCSAGTAEQQVTQNLRRGQVKNAVSADGKRIYWTASATSLGRLYLREEASTTIAVSKGPAQFWGASASGDRVIFSEGSTLGGGTLFEWAPEEDPKESGKAIAGGLLGVAGMSEDARVVYFASTEALVPGASAGKPNLYRYELGADFEFIGTLSSGDLEEFSPVTIREFRHLAKASPGGNALAFMSNNGLTGQDSRDVETGEPVSQVYLYDAEADELHCVSCNETGARPVGRNISRGKSAEFWASGLLPTASSQLYYPHVLSADGKRLFFNSFEGLAGRDTNGAMDVYQWEAQGRGSCTEPGGCTSLISSGQSPGGSEFLDASADGDDVFFTTGSSLVARDTGLVDIYDARVGGGFPPPSAPPAQCEGEACQGAYVPPADPAPNSASFRGAGNVVEDRPRRPRCPKGKRKVKRKGKVRCVKPRKTKKRRAGHSRSASKHNDQRKNGRRGS